MLNEFGEVFNSKHFGATFDLKKVKTSDYMTSFG